MRAKKVEEFLSVQTDVPKHLRDAMIRMHRGRSPMWKAIGAKRGISQIVEVAERGRCVCDGKRYAVIRWYWNDCFVGMRWTAYGTLREARAVEERTFRIDAAHLDIRA